MKKIIAVCLVITLVCSLFCGCGAKETKERNFGSSLQVQDGYTFGDILGTITERFLALPIITIAPLTAIFCIETYRSADAANESYHYYY